MGNIEYENRIRYQWIDVLRFLAIFAVYLGHTGTSSGKLTPFVYSYHIALFFFISGFFITNKCEQQSFREYFMDKINKMLIPYYLFQVISIVFYSIQNSFGTKIILGHLINAILSIRSNLLVVSLWFIPCLFLVNILYYFLYKTLKNKLVILAISLLLNIIYYAAQIKYELPYNAESVMIYLFYFALGSIAFKYMEGFSYKKMSTSKKIVFLISSLIAVFITCVNYINGSWYWFIKYICEVKFLYDFLFLISPLYAIVICLFTIYANILVSVKLEKFHLLQTIGKKTLVLCGTENMLKVSINELLGLVGKQLVLANPLSTVIYTFLCLVISNFTFAKFFDKLLHGGK